MSKGGSVIFTGVLPCLSSVLAKNDKIMSMLVPFSLLFGYFQSWLFFENGGKTLHKGSQI